MPKVVVFLDALDPRHTIGFLNDMQEGSYACDFPCVTPANMGGILTGEPAWKHGLVCPTRFERPSMQKPAVETVIEKVAKRMRVLAHGIPFTSGIKLERGISGDGGGTDEEAVAVPALVFPQKPLDMGHVDPHKAYQVFVDHASCLFATFRQFIRNNVADAYFIGFRNLDSFTHWYQDGPWYNKLQNHLCSELMAFGKMGNDVELFVFSDHGSMPATDLFRMNVWFIDRRKLFFRAFWNKQKKEMERRVKVNPDRVPYKDQIGPFSPYIEIAEKSKFINADAFDACVDVVGEVGMDEVREMAGELMGTGAFDAVHVREDVFAEADAEQMERLPNIIPYRKPGILVSSNMWPTVPAWGFTKHEEVLNKRNGDHWPEGYWGCTGESPGRQATCPQDLFSLIDEFCGDGPESDKGKKEYDESEAADIAEKLANLGYM